MKHLVNYYQFFEASISMAESLGRYLEHSPAMQDIKALVSKGRISATRKANAAEGEKLSRIKEPMSYTIKREGDIYFDKNDSYRYFGQEAYLIRQSNGYYNLRIEENSKFNIEENIKFGRVT